MPRALAAPATLPARAIVLSFGLALGASASVMLQLSSPLIAAAIAARPPTIAHAPRLRPALSPNPGEVQPFVLQAANPAEADRAVRCLTDAIYYEAATEPVEGQRAVAQVVLNRVRDPHFPKSVCGVVYEGWQRHTGCQFSFTCDGSIRRRRAVPALWTELRPIAMQALNGYVERNVGTATHYYAQYVRPNWVRSVARVTEIGQHIFCRWKGRAGQPAALDQTYQGGELKVADAALAGQAPAPVRTAVHAPVRLLAQALVRTRHRARLA